MDTVPSSTAVDNTAAQRTSAVSWPAILAGVATAAAVQFALSEACFGFGLSLWDVGEPVAGIAVGTAIAWVICGFISLLAGGWVAGRLARRASDGESFLHGVAMWATVAILGALLAATALGALAGGAATIIGKGLDLGAQVAGGTAQAAGGVMQSVAPDWNELRRDLTTALDRADAAATQQGQGAGEGSRMADRSRLMQLLGQSFTTDADGAMGEREREELVALLAAQTGMSADAARRTYDQWKRVWDQGVQRYEAAKAQALEAARVAKKRTAQAAIWACMAMIVGLAAAAIGAVWGGHCGVRARTTHVAGVGPVAVPHP